MTDKTRLIEVAFPLKQASLASVHEKNVRHGHISTLHIWPARRPLAACRAALLATLLPDPGDPAQRRELLEKMGGNVVKKLVEDTDDEGRAVVREKEALEGGILAWGEEDAPAMAEFREMLGGIFRGAPPTVFDPFAGGGAIPLEAMRLGCQVTASDLNPVAWLILKCTLDYPRLYAGKKWPLPPYVRDWPDFVEDFLNGKVRKRKPDKKHHFSDPTQLRLSDLPPADITWQLRAWGRWVLERAKADLAGHYPVVSGETVAAYLWARTARDKITSGRIPLLKTFWLCKAKGRRAAILLVPNEDKSSLSIRLLRDADIEHPERIISDCKWLRDCDVTAESLLDFLNAGTMNRAGVWSPLTGRPGMITLTMDDLRRQGQQGLLSAQITAVAVDVAKPAKNAGRHYRLPTEAEIKAAEVATEELESLFADIPFGLPVEPTPIGGGSGAGRAFSLHNYGLKRWIDIFLPRQLLALGTFAKHTREAIEVIKETDPNFAEAGAAFLTILFGRLLNYMSTMCIWDPAAAEVKQTFSRYAFPITWDFSEANPLAESDRYYAGGIQVAARALSALLKAAGPCKRATVLCESSLVTRRSGQQIVFTDPPYYDAIPYSDLMDFFFVWQRRILTNVSEEYRRVFDRLDTPKWNPETQDGELIQDESRHQGDKLKAKSAYETGMARAFQSCCESMEENGRFVVVFANQDVDAWETLVSAIIRSGFVVCASWPIQTEMPGGFRNFNRASLASSIWIVCRKRPKTASVGWEEHVLERMRHILFDPRETLGNVNILQYYFDLGIHGPDFIWAAVGPALEAYSTHLYVKRTGGGVLTVPDFLAEVRKLVLHFSLGELPGFRELQRETQGRGETIELDPVTQYYLLHRAYFKLEPAPAGACILYANACGKNETELRLVWNILEQGAQSRRGRPRKQDGEDTPEEDLAESRGNQFRLLRWDERAAQATLGDSKGNEPAPLIDRLHRMMFLFQQNRASEMRQLFDAWGLASDRAFKPLLQAVRELALRDKQEGERKLVEALATQLRLNRKTVMVANEVKEMPLFEPATRE